MMATATAALQTRYKRRASGDNSVKPRHRLGRFHSLVLAFAWLVALGNAIATTLYVHKAEALVEGEEACKKLHRRQLNQTYNQTTLLLLTADQSEDETWWSPSSQRDINLSAAWMAFIISSISIFAHFGQSAVAIVAWLVTMVLFICSVIVTLKMNVDNAGLRADYGWCWKDEFSADYILRGAGDRRNLLISVVVLSSLGLALSLLLNMAACATVEPPRNIGDPDITIINGRRPRTERPVYSRPGSPVFQYNTQTSGVSPTRTSTPPPPYTPTVPESVRHFLSTRRGRPDPTAESGLVVPPLNTFQMTPLSLPRLAESMGNRTRNTSDGSSSSNFRRPRLRREDSQHTLVEGNGWGSNNPYRIDTDWPEPRWDEEHSNGYSHTRNRANSIDSLALTVVESDSVIETPYQAAGELYRAAGEHYRVAGELYQAAGERLHQATGGANETSYQAAGELESGTRATEERMPGAWTESSSSLPIASV